MTHLKQNKIMKFTKVLVVLLAVLTIIGCRKDIDGVPTETVIPPSIPFLHDVEFQGIVVDEDGNPISDAILDFTSFTQTTDENGFFRFDQLSLNEDGSLITIEKDGYFQGYKFIFPAESNSSHIKIMLIDKGEPQIFNASTGGQIEDAGARVVFKENSIVVESNGAAYNGEVQAFFHWYNPELSAAMLSMPGDLRGVNIDRQQVALTTYGMVAVELFGSQGQKLNLAPNTTATISMQAPEYDNLPGNMPMWFFDEVTGFWTEEGEANLIDGHYVGEVSHFSFWNCDVPNDFIFLEGSIQTPQGVAISNAQIVISVIGTGNCGIGYTNEEGEFSGFVPNDLPLQISIFDECGGFLFDGPLGTFTEDTQLPPISANLTEELITIEGTVVCNGNPIEQGYVKVNYGEGDYTIIVLESDGSFSTGRLLCNFDGTNVSLTAFNSSSSTASEEFQIDSITTNLINVGILDACDLQAPEWFNVNIDGADFPTIFEVDATHDAAGLVMRAFGIDGGIIIRMYEPKPGDNQPFLVRFENLFDDFLGCSTDACSEITFNLNDFDKFTDGYIEGTFEGLLFDPNNLPHEVSGDFRIQFSRYIPTGKILGFAWEDSDMNGLFDNGEEKVVTENIFISSAGSGGGFEVLFDNDGNFFAYVEADTDYSLSYNLEFNQDISPMDVGSVSYTHLTLPTKRIV